MPAAAAGVRHPEEPGEAGAARDGGRRDGGGRAATVVRVEPEMVRAGAGWRIRIPAEADYGGDTFEVLDAPAI